LVLVASPASVAPPATVMAVPIGLAVVRLNSPSLIVVEPV
jgi:hypothetical protein